jgi:hypothetical protein
MSILTLDQALAGFRDPQGFVKVPTGTPVIGNHYSLWIVPGNPGAGSTVPTGNVKGQFFSSTISDTGIIAFPPAVAGDTTYLSRFTASAQVTGTLILADRIWADSLSAVGVAPFRTPIFSGSFPRSAGTGGGDSSGVGIMLGLEVFTALGATATTPKVTIIDQNGLGDTMTALIPIPATAAVGTFTPFTNGPGHWGCRSVSYFHHMVTHTSGTWGLVAYRPLARIHCTLGGVEDNVDMFTGGFPIVFEGSAPFLIWLAGSATIPRVFGGVVWGKG